MVLLFTKRLVPEYINLILAKWSNLDTPKILTWPPTLACETPQFLDAPQNQEYRMNSIV
jgi:hypothetical protein